MKKTKVEINDIKVASEYVFLKKVMPSGNGAIIPFFKRYRGHEVYIIIKKKCN